jgi:hypothetical protein
MASELADLLDASFRSLEGQDEADQQSAEDDSTQEPQLVYGNVYEFVSQWLRYMYRRDINGKSAYWKANWWECKEAESRLTELWRTWEYFRQDPIGMAIWWRDYCDPAMAVLLSEDGPLKSGWESARDRTYGDKPLACAPAPDGMFRDERGDGRPLVSKLSGSVPADVRSRALS